MPRSLPWLFLLAATACAAPAARAGKGRAELVVLGTAQDAGLPHLGCEQPRCAAARRDPARRAQVAAAALVAPDGRWWLLDATPDLPAQVHALGRMPEGVFLTHAHIGHYTGLMYFGREAAAARSMPVHCSPAMAEFLAANAPWSQLVELGQIRLLPWQPGARIELGGGLSVQPVPVPHRNEFADTHAFEVEAAGGRRALYLPDLDSWDAWDRELPSLVQEFDLLLIDGSFWSSAELPNRPQGEVPHPPVTETLARLAPLEGSMRAQIVFTHLNHTNPLWDPGPERAELQRRGYAVAARGQRYFLSP